MLRLTLVGARLFDLCGVMTTWGEDVLRSGKPLKAPMSEETSERSDMGSSSSSLAEGLGLAAMTLRFGLAFGML